MNGLGHSKWDRTFHTPYDSYEFTKSSVNTVYNMTSFLFLFPHGFSSPGMIWDDGIDQDSVLGDQAPTQGQPVAGLSAAKPTKLSGAGRSWSVFVMWMAFHV